MSSDGFTILSFWREVQSAVFGNTTRILGCFKLVGINDGPRASVVSGTVFTILLQRDNLSRRLYGAPKDIVARARFDSKFASDLDVFAEIYLLLHSDLECNCLSKSFEKVIIETLLSDKLQRKTYFDLIQKLLGWHPDIFNSDATA